MNTPRVKRLIEILEALPGDSVHMSCWTTSCGTPLCLAGHACADPILAKEGLRLNGDLSPEYDRWYDFDALSEFFELEGEFAFLIFGPPSVYGNKASTVNKKMIRERIYRLTKL